MNDKPAITLTDRQARQFILLKHGLLGEHKFNGKDGAYAFVRQAGCIQFDPVDVCGRNADLTLQSRCKNYKKSVLDDLLYKNRLLFDYPDKNTAIIPTEDWPYFERYRQASRENANKYPEMDALMEQARAYIEAAGPVCSDDMKLDGDFFWRSAIHWSAGDNLFRSVLEQMYSSGDLIIHHKNGTRKYYDLPERHISDCILKAPEPLADEFEHIKWRMLRRIGAIGLLWNRPSFAWLHIWGLTTEIRYAAFDALVTEGKLSKIGVDGVRGPLFCRTEDLPLIGEVKKGAEPKPRCELIAPLDPLLWDRQLIKSLFKFAYSWEIYTPADKRKYGVYVLPILFGEHFIGRIYAPRDGKTGTLRVKNIWYENDVKPAKKVMNAVEKRIKAFAAFNGCDKIEYDI